MARFPLLAPALAIALLVGATSCGDDGSTTSADGSFVFGDDGEDATIPTVDPEAVGRSVADVTVEAEDGSEVALGDYAGRPLVVNLYAQWCAPCRAELPAFQEVHADLGDQVAFLGVAVPPDLSAARRMAQDAGVTYDLAESPDGQVLVDLGAALLPVTAFVRADGTIAELRSGGLDEAELRKAIQELVA